VAPLMRLSHGLAVEIVYSAVAPDTSVLLERKQC
jgi:hypothetical protein